MILRFIKGFSISAIAILAIFFLIGLLTKKDHSAETHRLAGGNPVLARSISKNAHYFIIHPDNLKNIQALKSFLQNQCEDFRESVCTIQFWTKKENIPVNNPLSMTDQELNSRAGVYWLNQNTKVNQLTLEQNGKDIGQY